MAKYNAKPTIRSALENHPAATLNHEGGLAFNVDLKTRLFLQVASSLGGEDQFYKSGADSHNNLVGTLHEVAKSDPGFVLRLAYYARKELYLRSIPMVILSEFANSEGIGKVQNARKWVASIISRPDDMTELISYQLSRGRNNPGKQKIPFMLKEGVAAAFGKFDTYQLAKYNRPGQVKLVDILRLTHPKPRNDSESERYAQLRTGQLPTPQTWETVIGAKGSTKESWEEILPKMGYMALLRNLRNMMMVGVDADQIINKLKNETAIRNSKQFPFRFFSAYRSVEAAAQEYKNTSDLSSVLRAISYAMDISVKNVPQLSGTSLVMIDVSGSMDSELSKKSTVLISDIATLFGAILDKACDRTTCIIFGEKAMIVPLGDGGILENKRKLVNNNRVGCSTNAWIPITWATENKQKYDRFVLLSDMQCYDSSHGTRSVAEQFTRYTREINPETYFYSMDLTGYGTIQLPPDQKRLSLIAGFSDRILEFIPLFESDHATMINRIENIELPNKNE